MNPRLRRLDIEREASTQGELLVFHDPTGLAPACALDAGLAPLLILMDGAHTLDQIGAVVRQGDPDLPDQWLAQFVADLDQHYLLESPRYQLARAQMESDWNSQPTRLAQFAGRSYPVRPAELDAFLQLKLAKGAARLPAPIYDPAQVRGIVTPHIDFHRGGHVEAASYAPLIENVRATGQPFDTVVILGIAHQGVRYPYCAAAKSYATPLGTMTCDFDFVADLEKRVGPQMLAEAFAHKDEHSIEFAAVMCQHFPELKTAAIAPILCGWFWDSLRNGAPPETAQPHVGDFIQALREVTLEHESRGRKIGFIASVDGAHVGTQFGDDTPLTTARLKEIERADRDWCAHIEAGDRAALHAHFARDANRFNVDAHPALYTLMAAFPTWRAQLMDYDQAHHPDQNIVVSFASLALFEQ